jgi:hypothetical protein
MTSQEQQEQQQQSTPLDMAYDRLVFVQSVLRYERERHVELKRELEYEMKEKLAEHYDYIRSIEDGDLREAEDEYNACKRQVTHSQ